MKRRILKIFIYTVITLFVGGGLFYLITWYGFTAERQDVVFGVTFSTVMARQLGLEPRKVFDAIVDDLEIKKIRLPVYWSDVGPQEEKFIFDDYDYFVQQSEKNGVKLILAIGRKLPRWPECFAPAWATFEREDIDETSLRYIETVVGRYKNSPAIEYWQIENEPFHTFGSGCAAGKLKTQQVEREIALVRSLDSRPIVLTDSGEQGFWASSLARSDVTGVSMYLQVWNDTLGVVQFPFGPGFYVLKRSIFNYAYPEKKIIVSELEAEPWGPSLLPGYDLSFQKELMSAERFREVLSYARRSGFDTFYLWGVEWWYWLKESQNASDIWNEAKRLF